MTDADPRTGPDESGTVTITQGDGNAPQTALTIPGDALFSLSGIKFEYDDGATAATTITLFDDADGTGAGNVADQRDVFKLQAGESRLIDGLEMRDFEEDVLVQGDNNQDGDVDVTVYGTMLIALADVMEV